MAQVVAFVQCTPLHADPGGWNGGQWVDLKETLGGNTGGSGHNLARWGWGSVACGQAGGMSRQG